MCENNENLQHKPGDIVYGKVTNILGYGAFVLVDDYDGLVHISEFSDGFVRNINDFVKIGQEIKLRIIEIDEESKRMKLSYKQIHKTRGVRCRVPEYKIGFETIDKKLSSWMEEYEYDKKN